MAPQTVPRLEPIYRPRTPLIKGRPSPLEKGLCYTTKIVYCSSLSQASPKKTYGLLPWWQSCGERTLPVFSGITRPWLWTDTNSGRPKTSLWSTSQCSGLWQLGSQWSFHSGLSHSEPGGSSNPPWDFPASPGPMHNWNWHTQPLAEAPHWLKWDHGFFKFYSKLLFS